MIITDSDINEVERFVERLHKYYEAPDGKAKNPCDQVFFAQRPHLLMVLGYDEYRALKYGRDAEEDLANVLGLTGLSIDFDYESIYRDAQSGAWYWFEGMSPDDLHFVGPKRQPDRRVPFTKWFAAVKSLYAAADPKPHTLWLPSLWTPRVQRETRIALAETAPALLQAIAEERKALRDISPTQLEELVAELLRSRGLEIHVTKRSWDGGRDIVARGELIPGEPLVMAVEVKQKPIVGLSDVQRALAANQDFPSLMVATAGRFSSGVIKERSRNRYQLRLFLKDGVALSQWIDSYSMRREYSEADT